MLSVYTSKEEISLFKTLGSETRIQILMLLNSHQGMTMTQISKAMHMPISTIESHVNMLLNNRLIFFKNIPVASTFRKCFFTQLDQILINFSNPQKERTYSEEISVGDFADFYVTPTCGLANTQSFIGKLDEPRYFTHPNHKSAEIIWFKTGYIEYFLPNMILPNSIITEISLSFEICSEAPGTCEDWPSTIGFYLNQTKLGSYISPGDFGTRRGKMNPDWWYPFLNQYGLLKRLTINTAGTFLDGEPFSTISIDDLKLNDQSILKFRFEVNKNSVHPNGCTLFGKEFGDYNQGIKLDINYISTEFTDI